MKFKGVVFDFNGTLLWDTVLHNRAWDRFLEKHQFVLTDLEKNEIIHGRNNEIIFPDLFRKSLTNIEIQQFIHDKEALYRDLFLKDPIDFAPGAVRFIRFLIDRKIQRAIATASGWDNVDFYLSYLKLGDLVPETNIVYNNGALKSKPDPEIFALAIKRLELESREVVIFEDSKAGIRSAENAGAGKIIIVNSTGADYKSFGHDIITSFDQVDRGLF